MTWWNQGIASDVKLVATKSAATDMAKEQSALSRRTGFLTEDSFGSLSSCAKC